MISSLLLRGLPMLSRAYSFDKLSKAVILMLNTAFINSIYSWSDSIYYILSISIMEPEDSPEKSFEAQMSAIVSSFVRDFPYKLQSASESSLSLIQESSSLRAYRAFSGTKKRCMNSSSMISTNRRATLCPSPRSLRKNQRKHLHHIIIRAGMAPKIKST